MQMSEVIVTSGLRKTYKGGAEALGGLDLCSYSGEIYCLVGPNGAGKTTTLRIIGTQLLPTAGQVRVLGLDIIKDVRAVRRHLGVVPQEATPDPELKVWEHVFYYMQARGMGRREAAGRAEEALRLLGLWDRKDAVSITLSGGLRRRILIAMAVATRAEVLLLDEPTTGLDPVARRATWDALIKLKAGRSILLTTHSMEEAEALADRVAIIDKGRVLALGTVAELRRLLPAKEKVYINRDGFGDGELERYGRVETYGGKLVIYPRDRAAIDELVQMIVGRQMEVSVLPTSLEDVYVKFVRGENV
jgi:ABC-2 type transport system ATP-binding protein